MPQPDEGEELRKRLEELRKEKPAEPQPVLQTPEQLEARLKALRGKGRRRKTKKSLRKKRQTRRKY